MNPKKTWEKARAYYESGRYTPIEIAQKLKMDRTTLQKRAKRENWEHGKNKRLIDSEMTIVNDAAELQKEKSDLNEQELIVHDQAIKDIARNRRISSFLDAGLGAAAKAAVELMNSNPTMAEIRDYSRFCNEAAVKLGTQPKFGDKNEKSKGTNNGLMVFMHESDLSGTDNHKYNTHKPDGTLMDDLAADQGNDIL